LEILDLIDFKTIALLLAEESLRIELPHLSACRYAGLQTNLHLYLSMRSRIWKVTCRMPKAHAQHKGVNGGGGLKSIRSSISNEEF